jgi:tetrahydromethanopterin S-methyltransferase subunit G
MSQNDFDVGYKLGRDAGFAQGIFATLSVVVVLIFVVYMVTL